MSYTNGTPFLNLPQTIGSDHRDWFDTNEPFLDLDTKVKTLWDDSGSAASAIDALQELTATLQTDLTTLSGTVDTHTSALSTINEALVLINGTLSTLNTSVATKFDSAGIADPYDAEHGIYAVGDVVTYNGQRYVCSTAVTAAEPFDADKWTAEDVQTVINGIKSDLTDLHSDTLFTGSVTVDTQITLSSHVNNYRFIQVIINDLEGEGTLLVNSRFGDLTTRGIQLVDSVVAYNGEVSPAVMAVADLALTNTDGIHYTCVRSAQANLTSSSVSYLSGSQTFSITIYGCW